MVSSGNIKTIAIGASTGGVDALATILKQLPPETPPILLTIHMQPGMTRLYADQLDNQLVLSVKEAETGDALLTGSVLVAPTGKHMKVVNRCGNLSVNCQPGEKVQHALPSVDVLFESVAEEIRGNAIGVILTGIGADGARGLLKMRNSGASTIGQDEDTCVVYGMPKVANEMGAVMYELPLNQIADKILSLI